MRRGLLAMAALLGLSSGLARADYILIVAYLEEKPQQGAGGAMGAMGAMGAQGAVGAGGAMGAMGAIGPGGGGGVGGFIGQPPQFPAQGAQGAMGAMGAIGVPPNLGAMGAMGAIGPPNAGAMGAIGPPNAGAMGAIGPPNAGAMGAMGNIGVPPNLGAMGAMGFGGGNVGAFGALGAAGGQAEQPEPPGARVFVVIQADRRFTWMHPIAQGINIRLTQIKHRWGRSTFINIPGALEEIALTDSDGKSLAPVGQRFKAEYTKFKAKKNATSQDRRELAESALKYGLLKELGQVIEDWKQVEPNDPTVKLLVDLKTAFDPKNASPLTDDSGELTKTTDFKNYEVERGKHYALLHFKSNPEEVKSRLARLDEAFEAFFYWHALHGKKLELPKKRQLALMVHPGRDLRQRFSKLNAKLGSMPITNDCFYSPRHNLLVLAGTRLDPRYQELMQKTAEVWQKYNRDGVMKDPKPEWPANTPGNVRLWVQTLALLTKSLEEDAIAAAVSHGVAKQLLVSTGLLPGAVALPQWLQNGVGSFFETPRASPWTGYGAINWYYLLTWRKMREKKGGQEKHLDIIKKVISDGYFREVKKQQKKDDAEALEAADIKARTTAWALSHFLHTKKLKELHTYYRELSRLPRDMELTEQALITCFARAFGCLDEKGKVNETELEKLADTWMDEIDNQVNLDPKISKLFEVIFKYLNELREDEKKSS